MKTTFMTLLLSAIAITLPVTGCSTADPDKSNSISDLNTGSARASQGGTVDPSRLVRVTEQDKKKLKDLSLLVELQQNKNQWAVRAEVYNGSNKVRFVPRITSDSYNLALLDNNGIHNPFIGDSTVDYPALRQDDLVRLPPGESIEAILPIDAKYVSPDLKVRVEGQRNVIGSNGQAYKFLLYSAWTRIAE